MKDGGRAFPLVEGPGGEPANEGMTLRDYFAAHAPTIDPIFFQHWIAYGMNPPEVEAKWCYAYADAMLQAREESNED